MSNCRLIVFFFSLFIPNHFSRCPTTRGRAAPRPHIHIHIQRDQPSQALEAGTWLRVWSARGRSYFVLMFPAVGSPESERGLLVVCMHVYGLGEQARLRRAA